MQTRIAGPQLRLLLTDAMLNDGLTGTDMLPRAGLLESVRAPRVDVRIMLLLTVMQFRVELLVPVVVHSAQS